MQLGAMQPLQGREATSPTRGTLPILRAAWTRLCGMPGEVWKQPDSLAIGRVLASPQLPFDPGDTRKFFLTVVQWGQNTWQVRALLDSGAAENLLNAGLAQKWGVLLITYRTYSHHGLG